MAPASLLFTEKEARYFLDAYVNLKMTPRKIAIRYGVQTREVHEVLNTAKWKVERATADPYVPLL